MKNVWSYIPTPSYFFHMEWCFKYKKLIFLVTQFLCLFCLHEVLKWLHSLSRNDCCHTNKITMQNLYMNTFIKCIHHTWIQFNILYFVMFGYNKDKQMKKKSYTAWWQKCHVAIGLESIHCNDVPCSICNPDRNCCPNLHTQIWVNWGFIQGVSKLLIQTSGVSSPHTNTRIHINTWDF